MNCYNINHENLLEMQGAPSGGGECARGSHSSVSGKESQWVTRPMEPSDNFGSRECEEAKSVHRDLIIGCGNSRTKKVTGSWTTSDFVNPTFLDIDPGVNPDVVWDLNVLPYPFEDNSFDEIHATEVLEHTGQQGDWKFFFAQFHELWRMLKPGGLLVATCPMWDSPWSWGDPGHTRVITKQSLIFLDQREYSQIGSTAMTDYRPWWKGDFQGFAFIEKGDQFGFILKAIKE